MLFTGTELRHSGCSPSKREGSTFTSHSVKINLLQTCRQIYNEARFIPYSTNTFSFETPRNLRAFIHLLTQRSLDVNQAIRSIRIDLVYKNYDLHTWEQAFKAVTQHMTSLERVYVNIAPRPNWFMGGKG